MTEIEKAREALVEKLMIEGGGTRSEAEDVVAYFAPFIEASARAIAREEIEAAMAAHLEADIAEAMHGEIASGGRECDETGALTEEGGDPHSTDGRPAGHAGDKSPPAVEAPAAGDYTLSTHIITQAKAAYEKSTDNHPTIHSNRFPAWHELDDAAQWEWITKVARGDYAPAAGDLGRHLSHCNFGEHRGSCKYGPEKDCPALSDEWRWFGEAISRHEDTTALARRLAEALNKIWLSGEPEAHEREVESALTEARKAGLIE